MDVFQAAPVPLWEQDLSRVRQLLSEIRGDLEAHLDSDAGALDRFASAIRSVRVNPAALELFQAASETELVRSLERPIPDETRPVFRQHLIAFAERRGRFVAETVIRTLSGEARSVALRSRLPSAAGAPDLALISFVDITDRRRAELERDRFFELSLDLSCALSVEGALFEQVNPAFERILGYAPAELHRRPFLDLVHSDDLPATRRALEGVLEGKRAAEIACRCRHRDGSHRRIAWRTSLDPASGRLYAVGRDETERVRAEEARRQSEAMLRSVTDSSPDFIVLVDREARIAFINRVLPEHSLESVVGRPVYDFLPESERPVVRRSIERVIASGEPDRYETRYEAPGGEVRIFESRVAPVTRDGGVESLVVVGTDVTWRHDLVSALEARNAELERFSYTVSHDLKSPLISIRGFLGLLERDAAAGDQARVQDDVGRIRRATETMLELLEGLLELSRIGRVVDPSEQVDFAQLAAEAVAACQERLDAEGVSVSIGECGPPLWGDRRRLLEVVQNLLDNAVKHSGGRRARVEIGARGESPPTYYVRDDGVGIHPSYHDKVFGLFERLDSASEGTGIGLALVKRIVEAHGGRVWVESEGDGRGATFCFTIPAAQTET